MNVAIVGFAIEGKAAFDYWSHLGATITICDQDATLQKEIPSGVASQLGPDYLNNLDHFDLVVRSAGVPPATILNKNPALTKLTTVTNEFLAVCPTKHVIGVTGTKGKGTTSTLIAHILKAAGKEVYLGGNIGTPPLEFLPKLTSASWVVLELGSFQLIDLEHSPHIAVCLMVVPEHLDWHSDIAEYTAAKQRLFASQQSEDIAVYFADNTTSTQIASVSPGHKIPYYQEPGAIVRNDQILIDNKPICSVQELKLIGKHNWQNVCAAVTAAWQVTQDISAIRSVLTSFTGLEHRLELVREVHGIRYYDDSFGTTPETAMVAIEAFQQPKVIILGGSDKGATYDVLAQTVKHNMVRHVVLIGVTGPTIQAALEKVGYRDYSQGGGTMTDIVHTAQSKAQPGDIVLLSTGCASFGLFKNYKDRGNQFKQVVQALV